MKQPDFYKSCDIIEFLRDDNSEGKRLSKLFDAHGVKYLLFNAEDYDNIDSLFEEFTSQVKARNSRARKNNEPLYSPELHISCHGNENGIGWDNNTLIPWNKLKELLLKYSRNIDYFTSPTMNGAFAQQTSLISLSLSACLGSYANMNFFKQEPYPVGGFIAPNDEIYIEDCAQFFLKFYTASIKNPWNTPEKVQSILNEFTPYGPNGSVTIECFIAPLTANPNYKSN